MNIIVIDDDKLVALSLKTILESSGTVTVAAMGSSGNEAIELYRSHTPDVMLMDIRMDGMTRWFILLILMEQTTLLYMIRYPSHHWRVTL